MQKVTSVRDDDANEQGTNWQATGEVEGGARVELFNEPQNNTCSWLKWIQVVDERTGKTYWYQENL